MDSTNADLLRVKLDTVTGMLEVTKIIATGTISQVTVIRNC